MFMLVHVSAVYPWTHLHNMCINCCYYDIRDQRLTGIVVCHTISTDGLVITQVFVQ